MVSTYKILKPKEVGEVVSSIDEFAKDTFLGFNRSPKSINSKYLYDAIGSQIYEKIMDLPEYYLVKSEYEILNTYKSTFANMVGTEMNINLVELGAGNGFKTCLILKEFLKKEIKFEYVPIDISESAMENLCLSLNKKFPNLMIRGIVADYFDSMTYLKNQNSKCNVILFLGSNIGNFLHHQAMEFLYQLWCVLHDGDFLLIGFDLRKDLDKMIQAYNDSANITAEFNYNVLRRMNNELGSNFDLKKFVHYEPYDVFTGAMTSYLISLVNQEVYIKKLHKTFSFKKFEPILVEQSYKYTEEDIDTLALTTGFDVIEKYFDSNRYFCNALWQCHKLK